MPIQMPAFQQQQPNNFNQTMRMITKTPRYSAPKRIGGSYSLSRALQPGAQGPYETEVMGPGGSQVRRHPMLPGAAGLQPGSGDRIATRLFGQQYQPQPESPLRQTLRGAGNTVSAVESGAITTEDLRSLLSGRGPYVMNDRGKTMAELGPDAGAGRAAYEKELAGRRAAVRERGMEKGRARGLRMQGVPGPLAALLAGGGGDESDMVRNSALFGVPAATRMAIEETRAGLEREDMGLRRELGMGEIESREDIAAEDRASREKLATEQIAADAALAEKQRMMEQLGFTERAAQLAAEREQMRQQFQNTMAANEQRHAERMAQSQAELQLGQQAHDTERELSGLPPTGGSNAIPVPDPQLVIPRELQDLEGEELVTAAKKRGVPDSQILSWIKRLYGEDATLERPRKRRWYDFLEEPNFMDWPERQFGFKY